MGRRSITSAEHVLSRLQAAGVLTARAVDDGSALDAIRAALSCRECGHAFTTFCPSCRGRKGGATTTPKRIRAAKRAARVGFLRKRESADGDGLTG